MVLFSTIHWVSISYLPFHMAAHCIHHFNWIRENAWLCTVKCITVLRSYVFVTNMWYYSFAFLFVYSLALRPLRAMASLSVGAHSSLSTAFCHHLLTFVSHRSFSHLPPNIGLPQRVVDNPPVYSPVFSLLSFHDYSYYMSNPFQSLLFNICCYV